MSINRNWHDRPYQGGGRHASYYGNSPPLYSGPPIHLKQGKADSLMEAVTNTAIGFGVSLVTWIAVAWAYGIPMSWSTNLQVTGIFTIVSIVRQYVLRRLFNGRSVWSAIKGRV